MECDKSQEQKEEKQNEKIIEKETTIGKEEIEQKDVVLVNQKENEIKDESLIKENKNSGERGKYSRK